MYVLRALRPQQITRCSVGALPTCLPCLSTSSAAQQQHPQLMRVAQQESHGSSDPEQQQRPFWVYLGAGAAATAAGWTAWSYNNRDISSAPPLSPMQLAHASPRAQAAVAACCAGPLLHLMHGLNPTPAQLQGLAAALEADSAALGPELGTGIWGLAMLGAAIPQQQLARLAGAAQQQMQQLPVYDAILTGKQLAQQNSYLWSSQHPKTNAWLQSHLLQWPVAFCGRLPGRCLKRHALVAVVQSPFRSWQAVVLCALLCASPSLSPTSCNTALTVCFDCMCSLGCHHPVQHRQQQQRRYGTGIEHQFGGMAAAAAAPAGSTAP